MKTSAYTIGIITIGCLLLSSCSQDIDAPSLPAAQNATIAAGTDLDADVLFGVWEGTVVHQGTTTANTFSQRYRLDFQSVDDGEMLYSHWYADARTNDTDSVMEKAYTYIYNGKGADMTPSTRGLSTLKAVHTGDKTMELYAIEGTNVAHLCTLERISDPEPFITGVNRTMPQVGETVTVSGRNLQFVDHIYLPTVDGEIEVTASASTSRQITFVVPQADYAPGSVRCQSTGAHVSTYSPAYMFCDNCVFFKTFSSTGGTAPRYTGTEFESSINYDGALTKNNTVVQASAIPDGHSLFGIDVKNPETFLSILGPAPEPWGLDANARDGMKDTYLRFSTANCFQRVLDSCDGLLTADTPCSETAIQMDVYVYSDGRPEWTTGYISWRLNKNNSVGNMVANVAMWSNNNPVTFDDGWLTFTIPLSAFAETAVNDNYKTLGKLIATLKANNLITIMKLMNYDLDDTHTARALESFQFNMANVRLVSSKPIANKKE